MCPPTSVMATVMLTVSVRDGRPGWTRSLSSLFLMEIRSRCGLWSVGYSGAGCARPQLRPARRSNQTSAHAGRQWPHVVPATLFIDQNFEAARRWLPQLLLRRAARVHLVVSTRADVQRFTRCTGISPVGVMRVTATDAFPHGMDTHASAWTSFASDDVVILCAGPLGRVLAVHWFQKQPLATYLELGSFFDPELQPDGKTLGARYYGAVQCGVSLNTSSYRPRQSFRACNFRGDIGKPVDEQAVWSAFDAGRWSPSTSPSQSPSSSRLHG